MIDTPHGRIGMMICYDGWFPESARILSLKGAEILGVAPPSFFGTEVFRSAVAIACTRRRSWPRRPRPSRATTWGSRFGSARSIGPSYQVLYEASTLKPFVRVSNRKSFRS